MKCFLAILTVCLLGAFVPGNAAAQTDVADWLARATDRAPLLDDPAGLAMVLDHVRQQASQLEASAESHAEQRRRELAEVTGQVVRDFSTYRDLLRMPQANRGGPVVLRGSVKQSEAVTLGERTATVLYVVPEDAPSGMVAVLVDTSAGVPAEHDDLHIAGLFLRLAELPDGTVAPLIVAGDVVRETSASGVLPHRALWSNVEHRTRGVTPAEGRLYYRLLRMASAVDRNLLRKAAAAHIDRRRSADPKLQGREPFPTFVDIFQNPAEYEGQAVTLRGYAREIRSFPAGENAEGIKTLYEAWIYTEDSQSNPAVVVAAQATPGLPIGDDLQVPVQVTGYFFKIYGYHAKDTTRVAPMILAGKIELLPEEELDSPPAWLLAVGGLLAAAVLGWIVLSYVGIKRSSWKASQPVPDFTTLEGEAESQ